MYMYVKHHIALKLNSNFPLSVARGAAVGLRVLPRARRLSHLRLGRRRLLQRR